MAPMVRASTTPLRILALKYGADVCYTEELVDRSVLAMTRVENHEMGTIDYVKDMSKKSKKVQKRIGKNGAQAALFLRIDRQFEKGRLICQLGTGTPELALKAALHVQQDVAAIDINMGCPKKFSVGGGMGSALLSDPDRAASIIQTLRQNLTVPVSCKVRLLEDTDATLAFCNRMIDAGAMAIAIHGRRVGHDSTEAADWDTLRTVVQSLRRQHPNLPIMLNGDFYTRQEWMDFQEQTGASGVLLGRPALYNTSIFRSLPSTKLVDTRSGTASVTPTTTTMMNLGYDSPLLLSKTRVVQDYVRESVKYNNHYKNTKYVVAEMMTNRRAPTERTPRLQQKFPDGQTIAKVCSCSSMEDMCNLWGVDPLETMVVTHNANTNTNNSNGTERKQEAAQPGEHKYDDSYFMKHEKSPATDDLASPSEAMTNCTKKEEKEEEEKKEEGPSSKRPKLSASGIDC